MELRIGVVGHTLTRAKMRSKAGNDSGMSSKLRGLGMDDDMADNFSIDDDDEDILGGGGIVQKR